MKCFVEIDCNNAAFDDGNLQTEVARLLRHASLGIEGGFRNMPLFDLNGNSVGRAYLTEDNSSIQ